MSKSKRIRRSQFIYQFGIGAIVQIGNESFIGNDISFWNRQIGSNKNRLSPIPRLEKILNVKYFVSPPSAPSSIYHDGLIENKLPYYRFPQWLICKECDGLHLYNRGDRVRDDLVCKNCNAPHEKLQPIRWIYASKDGFLSDIAWSYLLHDCYENNPCRSDNLIYRTVENRGGGLSSIEIACRNCSTRKSVKKISEMVRRQKAPRLHPWQYGTHMEQYNQLNVSRANRQHNPFQQVGSSSLYQSLTASALDLSGSGFEDASNPSSSIESWYLQTEEFITAKNSYNEEIFKDFLTQNTERFKDWISSHVERCNNLPDKPQSLDDITIELASRLIKDVSEEEDTSLGIDGLADQESLYYPEWKILNGDGHQEYINFKSKKKFITDSKISKYIESVTQISKLREVRALYGFTRYHDSTNIHKVYMGDPTLRKPYYPAHEVFGEGIFLQFNTNTVRKWIKEENKSLKTRLSKTQKRRDELKEKGRNLPIPSPEFVLVHTFSHLLMNQLCFESGYSQSSVREKLYVDLDREMLGVLIYTADADSEGSLGGLVRMGEESRLTHSIRSTIDAGKWCSSDPTCIEIGSPGTLGLNRAACHACSLIPETSCILFNSMLDRAILFGSEQEGLEGFFGKLKN